MPIKVPSREKHPFFQKMMKNTLKVIVDAKKGSKVDTNLRVFL